MADVTIGTFNLNNLFGRWNLYVDVPQTTEAVTSGPVVAPAATDPPRAWLEPPPDLTPPPLSAHEEPTRPDVRIVIEGSVSAQGIRWRTNPYDGRVVYKKKPEAQKQLAKRIKAIDVDVLAVQEVENIESLQAFVVEQGLGDYEHLVLVEGNDKRLIDIAVMSRYPIGAVTSWRHRNYKNLPREEPVFSRDLLQVEVLSEQRKRVLFTLYNNHLKSRLAKNAKERRDGNRLRTRQAETIGAILKERPPAGPFLVVGDMNDTPTTPRLKAIRDLGLLNALTDPDESGGPYPADDPDQPKTKAWTHRFRAHGRTDYELFDQIWLSHDLAPRQTGAWINRRTSRLGDASDHDPAYIRLSL